MVGGGGGAKKDPAALVALQGSGQNPLYNGPEQVVIRVDGPYKPPSDDPQTAKPPSDDQPVGPPKWWALLPAALFVPCWLFVLQRNNLWAAAFGPYYPMSLGMILGSFIAGSTPLGGGIVGFPIAVLALGFSSPAGRDFACLIQAVGMNSAAFLLVVLKPHMLHSTILLYTIISGTLGCIAGLLLPVDPYLLSLGFTTYLTLFGIIYFYKNQLARTSTDAPTDTPSAADQPRPVSVGLLVVQGLVGGLLTSQLGSGSDCVLYMFGSFIWPCFEQPIPASSLTANSVVVMGALSLITATLRAAEHQISEDVYLCFLAAAPVVCFGAPVGAFVLRPGYERWLRYLFYLLVIVQLVSFGVVVVGGDWAAWAVMAGLAGVTVAALGVYHVHDARHPPEGTELSHDATCNGREGVEAGSPTNVVYKN